MEGEVPLTAAIKKPNILKDKVNDEAPDDQDASSEGSDSSSEDEIEN